MTCVRCSVGLLGVWIINYACNQSLWDTLKLPHMREELWPTSCDYPTLKGWLDPTWESGPVLVSGPVLFGVSRLPEITRVPRTGERMGTARLDLNWMTIWRRGWVLGLGNGSYMTCPLNLTSWGVLFPFLSGKFGMDERQHGAGPQSFFLYFLLETLSVYQLTCPLQGTGLHDGL